LIKARNGFDHRTVTICASRHAKGLGAPALIEPHAMQRQPITLGAGTRHPRLTSSSNRSTS
jgi:hypothetical protein